MLKFLKGLVCFLLVLILLVVGGTAGFNVIALRDFYAGAGQKEFLMAGAKDPQYDQQALDVDDESGLFFFGGYMKDGSASRIYVIDPATGGEVNMVQLANQDGTPHTNHSGGLAVCGDYVYMAGSRDECLYVFERKAILEAENGAYVPSIGTISLRLSDEIGIRASFVGRSGSTVYVGEFYLPLIPNYQLRANHQLESSSGTTHALMVAYQADSTEELGLGKPVAIYALPDQVQGMAVVGEQFVLSESFMPVPSRLETVTPVYDSEVSLVGEQIPLYTLQSVKKQYAIPMSEGIVYYNGRIYISSELDNFLIAGLGNLWGGAWCWSIAP